jgi:hypothetical protein
VQPRTGHKDEPLLQAPASGRQPGIFAGNRRQRWQVSPQMTVLFDQRLARPAASEVCRYRIILATRQLSQCRGDEKILGESAGSTG